MTLEEGQDLQAQNAVDSQVGHEIRQNSGRKPRTETKSRRCGNCGEPGHNARTCQIDSPASEEDDSDVIIVDTE